LKLVQSLAVIVATSLPCIGNAAWLYEYTGIPFEDNRIAGSTFISVSFQTATPLSTDTLFEQQWWTPGTLTISDGAASYTESSSTLYSGDTRENGPLLRTDQAGNIDLWSLIVLGGANRTFSTYACCDSTHPPVMGTVNLLGHATVQPALSGGATDFSLRNSTLLSGAEGYSYNNVMPGTWSVTPVPEPHEWAMMLAGLGMVGWVARRRIAITVV
jgi:hypothetical protein